MFYEGDPIKEIRIKYKTLSSVNEFNHERNVCIEGFYGRTQEQSDWQNFTIGFSSKDVSYRNVLIGNNTRNLNNYSPWIKNFYLLYSNRI
jgi:hypothetical protein